MIPVWIYLGTRNHLPWTWYLMVPAIAWIAIFMLVDRRRHQRPPQRPGDTLRQTIENSLAQVQHQIWLLRNVHWWYLLPPLIPMLAFVAHVAWSSRGEGLERWLTGLFTLFVTSLILVTYFAVYRLNQSAVASYLEPRRRELETLLNSLQDEPPPTNT
jgi:hypothetical protein